MAKAALDLGYYISLSGIVTFRNADALREVARQVPVDRLLVETDSPYLAPIPHRGKPNLPQYVREVAEYVACCAGPAMSSWPSRPPPTSSACSRWRGWPDPQCVAGAGQKTRVLGGIRVKTIRSKTKVRGPWAPLSARHLGGCAAPTLQVLARIGALPALADRFLNRFGIRRRSLGRSVHGDLPDQPQCFVDQVLIGIEVWGKTHARPAQGADHLLA
jgi:hypothetical protein